MSSVSERFALFELAPSPEPVVTRVTDAPPGQFVFDIEIPAMAMEGRPLFTGADVAALALYRAHCDKRTVEPEAQAAIAFLAGRVSARRDAASADRRVCKCGTAAGPAWEADPGARDCPGCGAVWPENLREPGPMFTCECGVSWPRTRVPHRCRDCGVIWSADGGNCK